LGGVLAHKNPPVLLHHRRIRAETAIHPDTEYGVGCRPVRGSVAGFLRLRVSETSALSIVSAYFTIHAYQALKSNLDGVERLRFLFGEPRFIGSLDPEKTERKRFAIEGDGLELANRLHLRMARQEQRHKLPQLPG
jgi:hypothetical protein